MKQRIFLTGGNGMVGSNILEHPAAVEYEFISPRSADINLSNLKEVQSFFKKEKFDCVIHAAGRVGGIQANMANPVEYLVENIDIGRNVILSAREQGIKKLVNLGSSCMYPRFASSPLSEDLILTGELEPTNEGYAIAKVFAAKLCQYISREDSKYLYKTLIPSNLYGRFDKFSPENSHLIPAVIKKIHEAKKLDLDVVEIWGDGTARREFMYAGDLANAVFKVLHDFQNTPNLMNIGYGTDLSVQEYYEAIAKIIGWNGRFTFDLTRPVGMQRKLVSSAVANDWGWSPEVSLMEGLKKAYDFYMETGE